MAIASGSAVKTSATGQNIDPGTGDNVTLDLKAPSGGVEILERDGTRHRNETRKRLSIPREHRYENIRKMAKSQGGKINGLTADEWIKFIEAENAAGRPVHVTLDTKIGKIDYLFQPRDKDKREPIIAAAEEAAKKGFWERNAWLKWLLIGLGTAGVGFLVGYMIKRSRTKTKTVTKTIDNTGGSGSGIVDVNDPNGAAGNDGNTNTDGNHPVNTPDNGNTSGGNSGSTLEQSGTPVPTTPDTGLGEGNVSGGLTIIGHDR